MSEKAVDTTVKSKRPSLLRRIVGFIREVIQELSKVTVPTRKSMVSYAILVFVFVLVVVGLVTLFDWLFAWLVAFTYGSPS